MLPVRNITFKSDDAADIALSKLDWKVEKVKRLTNPFLNHSTADTARSWVGRIDKGKKEFKIIQTAPYFSPRILECNFFQVFVHGQIVDDGQKAKIILKFRLGMNTLILFIFIYFLPVLLGILYTKAGNESWKELLFMLLIPILFTLLLMLQLNKTENKLIDLFGV